jgi:hypothetical protein
MKTVNRGMLLRRAKSGKLEGRCRYHYTDDYYRDAENNYDRMPEYKPVRILPEEQDMPAEYHELRQFIRENPSGFEASKAQNKAYRICRDVREAYRKEHDGCLFLEEDAFQSECGRAWKNGSEPTINMSVHRNLLYELRIVEA